jgi:hypothetical protein
MENEIPSTIYKDSLNRLLIRQFDNIDEILTLSDDDFAAWVYLKSRYHHGLSEFISNVVLEHYLINQKD